MASEFRVVAIVAAYNEEDVIAQTVGDLVAGGVGVYLLDHGSTDRTVAEVMPFLGRGVLAIERFPPDEDAPDVAAALARFSLAAILRRKEALARTLEADWLINADADEIRESPWRHLSLAEAIRQVDRFGYDAIDFAVLDFPPTDDAFRPGQDLREAFRFFEPGAAWNRVQIRAWKKRDDVRLEDGGHDAFFPGRRVFPIRFLLRHYPIRSQAHGERKVFAERMPRFAAEERARGWHRQYEGLARGHRFLRDPATLRRYDPEVVRFELFLHHRVVEELRGHPAAKERALVDCEREKDALSVRLDGVLGEKVQLEGEMARLEGEKSRLEGEKAWLADELRAERVRLEGEKAWLQGALAAERARLEDALAHQRAENAGLRAGLDDAERRVADLLGSRTWRWTAPLRAIGRRLGA